MGVKVVQAGHSLRLIATMTAIVITFFSYIISTKIIASFASSLLKLCLGLVHKILSQGVPYMMSVSSEAEKTLLKEFRERLTDLELTGDQDSDIFLLRWIRAQEYKLQKSEDMLRKSLKWREEFGADSILTWEPPSELLELLPYDSTCWDKENQPVLIFPFGRWNLKNVVDLGYNDQWVRCNCKLWEELLLKMKGKTGPGGIPVTKYTAIIDMEGLGLTTVWSFAVMEMQKKIADMFERNYPEFLSRAFIINVPKVFQMIWVMLKPLISGRTAGNIHILSSPSSWKPLLLEAFDSEQLPEFYGGSKDSCLHPYLKHAFLGTPEKTIL